MALSVFSLVIAGCASDKPAIEHRPYDFDKMAMDVGMKPFAFPRGLFTPGTLVRLDQHGAVASSPVGTLGTCAPSAKLAPVKGSGLSGDYLSAARKGLRLDLSFFGNNAAGLKADLGVDAYALLIVEKSYSLLEYETTIRDTVTQQFGQMSAACREVLREPSVSVLTEVYYATAGSRMRFFQGNGARVDLSGSLAAAATRAFASAGSARVDAGDLLFNDDLPLFYSAVKANPPLTSCPFDLRTANEPNYLSCVKSLPPNERDALLSEVSRVLRREFEREKRDRQFRDSTALVRFFLAVDPDNGHGLYYDGALTRWLNDKDRTSREFLTSHVAYRRYLQVEPSIPASQRDGDAESCYARGRGYCTERTAWINHQMANDLYELASKDTRRDVQQERLKLVKQHAEACIALRPKQRCFTPGALLGFSADQLIARANEILSRLPTGNQ